MSSSIEQRTLTEDERKALLRQAGNALIVNLHSLTRATSLHDLNNRSLDRPADGIVEALTQLRQVERLSISLNTSQGAVYVNATRLMLEQQSFSFVQSLESFFGRVDSSGLRFADELTTDQIKAYLHFANRWRPPVGEKNVLPLFRKALREARLTGVEPTQRIRITVDGEEHRLPGVLGLQTYAKMVAAFNRLMAQPVIPLSLAQRLVQDLLDALRVEGDLLLALTIVPVSEMSFVRRTVNTTIITLAMMQNLGTFPRSLLSDVGLAALLGRVEEHRRSSESGAQAEDEVWRPLEALGKPAELSPGGVRTLLASFEQHKHSDGRGIPELVLPSKPLVGSQLISLAQELQDRIYQEDGSTRPFQEVIYKLIEQPDRHALEVLLLLVQTFGVMPVGTVVQLVSGEIGVVIEQPRRSEKGAPTRGALEGTRVRLLFDEWKEFLPGQTVVTLGQTSLSGQTWRVSSVLDVREHSELTIQAMLDNPESVLLQLKMG